MPVSGLGDGESAWQSKPLAPQACTQTSNLIWGGEVAAGKAGWAGADRAPRAFLLRPCGLNPASNFLERSALFNLACVLCCFICVRADLALPTLHTSGA